MSSVESNTLTFVVTIWIDSDDISEPISETSWRGERNVLQNESKRVAFTSLADIEAHIQPYLEDRGVQFGLLYWLRKKLHRFTAIHLPLSCCIVVGYFT